MTKGAAEFTYKEFREEVARFYGCITEDVDSAVRLRLGHSIEDLLAYSDAKRQKDLSRKIPRRWYLGTVKDGLIRFHIELTPIRGKQRRAYLFFMTNDFEEEVSISRLACTEDPGPNRVHVNTKKSGGMPS